MNSFGKRLRVMREVRGMKAAEVARSLGVSESTYRDWENGREIRGEPYVRLAGVFGTSVSELLGGESAEKALLREKLGEVEKLIQFIRTYL